MALCAMAAASQIAVAQENGNRDENNKIVRGPYLTNDAGDNWWINLGTGFTAWGDGGLQTGYSPLLDFNFGKWFTPSIGARVGYQGVTGAVWNKNGGAYGNEPVPTHKDWCKQKFGYSYVHGDLMWNISNAFSGYKETRFWDVIPYLHAGAMMVYQRSGKHVDGEFAMGAGLYNTMRLSNRVDLTLDVRGTFMKGSQLTSTAGIGANLTVALGVAVNLGKTNFTRKTATPEVNETALAKVSELELANEKLSAEKEELAAQKKELADKNDKLAKANKKLKKAVQENEAAEEALLQSREGVYSNTFYFTIGNTELSKTERQHLDFYVNKIRVHIKKGQTITLTARCDKETGSLERNEFLAKERVKFMKELLIKEYGLEDANFETSEIIINSNTPELDRAIVINFK